MVERGDGGDGRLGTRESSWHGKGKDAFPVSSDGSVHGNGIEGGFKNGFNTRAVRDERRIVLARGNTEWAWRWMAWERTKDDEAASQRPTSYWHDCSPIIQKKEEG